MAAAGNDAAEKIQFPISGAFSSSGEWVDVCAQALQEKQLVKLQSTLNGYRVTAWRICIEKRRKKIADMIGANIELKQLPSDCRNRILEFLPNDGTDPNVRGGAVTAFEVGRKVQRRREELAEKWAKKMTDTLLQMKLGDPAPDGDDEVVIYLREKFIQEPASSQLRPNGEVWNNGDMMNWWKFPVLKTKIESLGYVWQELDYPEDAEQRLAEGRVSDFEREYGFQVLRLSIPRRARDEVEA